MFYLKKYGGVEKVQYKTLQVVYDNCMGKYDNVLALDNKL